MERRAFLQLGIGVIAASGGVWSLTDLAVDGSPMLPAPRRLVPGLPMHIDVPHELPSDLHLRVELRCAGVAVSRHDHPLRAGAALMIATPAPAEPDTLGRFEVWARVQGGPIGAPDQLLGGYELLPLRFGC